MIKTFEIVNRTCFDYKGRYSYIFNDVYLAYNKEQIYSEPL